MDINQFFKKEWQAYKSEFAAIIKLKATKRMLVVLLFLFCIGINIHLRLFPAYFPQLKEKATVTIFERVYNQVGERVNSFYPGIPAPVKKSLVDKTFNEEIKNKKKFKKLIDSEYSRLKDYFQDPYGQSYLLELDPYQWMRAVRNVLRYGHPGDKKINGRSYDSYMLAPKGMEFAYSRFLFYISAFFYKITRLFADIRLEHFLLYIPVLYTLLFLTAVFLIAKKIFSPLAGFFAVIFIGLEGIFLTRSCAGWFDSDSLSVLLPLLIAWLISFALQNKGDKPKLVFYSLCASFFQGLYSFTWMGWWVIFIIILVFIALSLLNNYFLYSDDIKKANKDNLSYLLSGAVFVLGSFFFCFIVAGINLFAISFTHAKEVLWLGKSVGQSIWPNTYYTVSELLPTNIGKISKQLHGGFIFVLSLVSMLVIYIKERRGKYKDFIYIMFFWFVFMLFASFKSIRFIIFLSIPLGFSFGAFLAGLPKSIFKNASLGKELKIGLTVFVLLFYLFPVRAISLNAKNTAKSIYPMMNDSWYHILTNIKNNTPPDSIVNSWWDYGDLFKPFADRRVIFDGQSQHTHIAYWMANILLSKDEKYAVKVLRMLNNASDTTFDALNKHIKDPYRSLFLLKRLFSLGRTEAAALLEREKLPADTVSRITADLYDTPPPAYFIVEHTMMGKMASISFLGNWDFIKLYIHRNRAMPQKVLIDNLVRIFGITAQQAKVYYGDAIMIPPGKRGYEAFSQRYKFNSFFYEGYKQGNMVYFDSGLVYDMQGKQALVYVPSASRYFIPRNIYVSDNGKGERLTIANATFFDCAGIFKTDDKYTSIFFDEALADSLYYRLFFQQGRNSKYFEPFFRDDNAKIYVFRIKWEECDD